MTRSPHPVSRRAILGLAAGVVLPAIAWPQAAAVRYEGQSFDTRVRLAGAELRLNGTGVRQVAWFKGYLAALYLTVPASTAADAVAAPGPKRIQLRMLHEVPAVEFSKALRKGVGRNAAPSTPEALNERVERLVRDIDAIGKVRAGDRVDLDFEPGRGLLMSINGTLRSGPIPGDDFYGALLRSFVGERVYDDKMRAGLLGQKP